MSEGHIHICRGVNRQFRGMVRLRGHRNYIPAGPWRKSETRATNEMLKKFLNGNYKRGDVWFISEYYDPAPILRITKL